MVREACSEFIFHMIISPSYDPVATACGGIDVPDKMSSLWVYSVKLYFVGKVIKETNLNTVPWRRINFMVFEATCPECCDFSWKSKRQNASFQINDLTNVCRVSIRDNQSIVTMAVKVPDFNISVCSSSIKTCLTDILRDTSQFSLRITYISNGLDTLSRISHPAINYPSLTCSNDLETIAIIKVQNMRMAKLQWKNSIKIWWL